MDALKVNSGMAHFRLITEISMVSRNRIRTVAHVGHAPLYIGLEAMAQSAALHVRYRFGFARHAFLLSVRKWEMPGTAEVLNGDYTIAAHVGSQSSDAFHYSVKAAGTTGEDLGCELLIGARDYDERFPEDVIKPHYEHLFSKLKV